MSTNTDNTSKTYPFMGGTAVENADGSMTVSGTENMDGTWYEVPADTPGAMEADGSYWVRQ